MKLLGVNIDHVATIRQQRHTPYPDVLEAGLIAQASGADSITVHLREDRRHIQPEDVIALKRELKIPLNLEMAATQAMLDFALTIKPKYCCLVPEKREELTTEGGLDVIKHTTWLSQVVAKLTQAGIVVSLFIDPDLQQIAAAKQVGAPVIELHTGDYAEAKDDKHAMHELQRIEQAAQYASELGLQVNAGHGLHYQNTRAIAAISQVVELNIGHAIIARALYVGLGEAVKEMLQVISGL